MHVTGPAVCAKVGWLHFQVPRNMYNLCFKTGKCSQPKRVIVVAKKKHFLKNMPL